MIINIINNCINWDISYIWGINPPGEQLATAYYFGYFIILLPAVSILENVLFYLAIKR